MSTFIGLIAAVVLGIVFHQAEENKRIRAYSQIRRR